MDRWTYRDAGLMLRFYRWAFAETTAGRRVQMSWCGRSLDADGWRREFRRALDHRINLKTGPYPSWRKLDDNYQRNLERDARAIRDRAQRRAALHQLSTPELRRRFEHLISPWND